MKTDKIFVLLLVILLPLTGCIDISENVDAQEETPTQENISNHHPVIFGSAYFGDYWHNSNSSTSTDVLIGRTLHALDFDGNVTDFGIDVDKDGIIDLPIQNWEETGAELTMVANSDVYDWKNPIEFDSWGNGDVEYCHQWLSIIAIDDDGDMTVEPFMVDFQYDDENDSCTTENTNG